MQAHVLIWCGIAVLVGGLCVLAYFIRQLWIGANRISSALDSVAKDLAEIRQNIQIVRESIQHVSERVKVMEVWAASWVAFQENIAKQNDTKIDDVNKRLISIETENKNTPPAKREDDDPFTGSRSWSAQAAAASRGLGVDVA